MDPVNHFDIKRNAHRISRRDSSQSWNPFRHLTWEGDRADTWNGNGDVEAQENGASLAHARSEPVRQRSGVLGGEGSRGGKEREEDDKPRGRLSESINENGETATESQQSHAPLVTATGKEGEPSNLRNRKQEGTNSTLDTVVNEKAKTDNKKEKPKQGRWIKHVRPKKPFTVANQLQRTFLNSWINILILAAPVGIALAHTSINGIAVFVVNFLAIIPLAAMLSFATEEIALRTGETLGGLLNATFG